MEKNRLLMESFLVNNRKKLGKIVRTTYSNDFVNFFRPVECERTLQPTSPSKEKILHLPTEAGVKFRLWVSRKELF